MDRLVERRVIGERQKNGKGWKREGKREREINRNRDGKRNRERNEVVNCDRISTNGVVENTCIFFEY